MSKKLDRILLFSLISFSVYCALIVGETWDQKDNLIRGGITLDYLFSLGQVDKDIFARQNYSTIYWSLIYFITKIFPSGYEIQVTNLVNLFFSFLVIIGLKNICKELFNYKVGKIAFIILFFYPVFFGHMGFNTKDTILAFSHVWISYVLLRYIKFQNIESKRNSYIYYLAFLSALATGIQMVFLGSLLPIIIFFFLEVFFYKRISTDKFNKKKLLFDAVKCFFIFYLALILFWIDAFPNIVLLPFTFLTDTLNDSFATGWPYNLINGQYFWSNDAPKSYIFTNILYKSPEYFLLSYFLFPLIYFIGISFFKKNILFFNYKLMLIISVILFPNILLFIIPYPLYDGLRLFLWFVPYLCIIPAITIYYLIENISFIKSKICLATFLVLAIFFLYNFFLITPYQYTYLNSFNGDIKNRAQKFENDYWGATIRELVNKAVFAKDKNIKIATCGINAEIAKKYFNKKQNVRVDFVRLEEAEYIIMTNRPILNDNTKKISSCFNQFDGERVIKVVRNGLMLSTISLIK